MLFKTYVHLHVACFLEVANVLVCPASTCQRSQIVMATLQAIFKPVYDPLYCPKTAKVRTIIGQIVVGKGCKCKDALHVHVHLHAYDAHVHVHLCGVVTVQHF